MPTARELYAAGRLDSAIETLGAELRSNPLDAQRRTFLFELLTFAGQYDRAAKQLDVLARSGADGELAWFLGSQVDLGPDQGAASRRAAARTRLSALPPRRREVLEGGRGRADVDPVAIDRQHGDAARGKSSPHLLS